MRACGDGRISQGMGWCFFFPEQSVALAGSSGGRGYYMPPQSPAVTHRPRRFVSLCECVFFRQCGATGNVLQKNKTMFWFTIDFVKLFK